MYIDTVIDENRVNRKICHVNNINNKSNKPYLCGVKRTHVCVNLESITNKFSDVSRSLRYESNYKFSQGTSKYIFCKNCIDIAFITLVEFNPDILDGN